MGDGGELRNHAAAFAPDFEVARLVDHLVLHVATGRAANSRPELGRVGEVLRHAGRHSVVSDALEWDATSSPSVDEMITEAFVGKRRLFVGEPADEPVENLTGRERQIVGVFSEDQQDPAEQQLGCGGRVVIRQIPLVPFGGIAACRDRGDHRAAPRLIARVRREGVTPAGQRLGPIRRGAGRSSAGGRSENWLNRQLRSSKVNFWLNSLGVVMGQDRIGLVISVLQSSNAPPVLRKQRGVVCVRVLGCQAEQEGMETPTSRGSLSVTASHAAPPGPAKASMISKSRAASCSSSGSRPDRSMPRVLGCSPAAAASSYLTNSSSAQRFRREGSPRRAPSGPPYCLLRGSMTAERGAV